jgi:hypothetical protein
MGGGGGGEKQETTETVTVSCADKLSTRKYNQLIMEEHYHYPPENIIS